MSNNDWYNDESWYAPLEREPEKPQPKAKKKNRKARVIGIVCLALVLLVGTSLAFREPEKQSGDKGIILPPSSDSGDMPETWTEFFDTYYEDVQTDVADIDIARAQLPIEFKLELVPVPETELSLQQLYQDCSPSIVAITGYVDGKTGYSWGTGVVLSEDGLILTNTHVIEDCDRATVTLYDDSVYEAELVGADANVPNVVGLSLDEAKTKLESAGFACKTVGSGAEVTDQTPAGGAIVPNNATILLYLGEEKPDTPATMPEVVGMTAAEANQAITNAGLIMKVTGATSSSSGNVRAISQCAAAGTQLERGSVVTVQFGSQSSGAD